MSLLFFDGFDGYDAIGDLTSFGGWVSSNQWSSLNSSVRIGTGKYFRMASSGASFVTLKKALASQAGNTLFTGFAFLPATPLDGQAILSIDAQCKLHTVFSAGSWYLQARNGATVLATASTPLTLNVWVYVECKILVHNSTGIFDCRMEGSSVFTFTGDTQAGGTNAVDFIEFNSVVSVAGLVYGIDDFYLCNSSGSVNNTYLGEVRAQIITPTSDSSITWTPNTGASNFEAVDDTIGAPDDDTTYVSSSTSAAKDEYGLSDLSGVNAVAGVKLVTRAKKDDANPKSFKHGVKSGSTNQQITYSLGIGYANYIDIFETSDGAGTPFNSTTVNSLLSTIEVA